MAIHEASPTGNWLEYRRLVLSELSRLDSSIRSLEDSMRTGAVVQDQQIAAIKSEVEQLKVLLREVSSDVDQNNTQITTVSKDVMDIRTKAGLIATGVSAIAAAIAAAVKAIIGGGASDSHANQ